jgi:predicted DNA-binding transcriptional regulator YafY
MTSSKFDALASTTRPPRLVQDRTRRAAIRLTWLITRLLRHDAVSFTIYEERFERSLRSFHRDIAVLRDAGFYLDASRDGWYRMLCFRPERDAA